MHFPCRRSCVAAALLLALIWRGGIASADVNAAAQQELIVGGFDPARPQDAERLVKELEQLIPKLQGLGFTSHEGYVRWNLCEPAEGKFDWSVYDQFVAIYKKHGIKWVPFIIAGSAYSLPDWYYKSPSSQGYVCLEHGQECDVQSLWNPALRQHVARFLAAFCDHYRDSGVIESILLGITGNYGEAIYPATGNDWTADIYGKYHTHAGFWAGDPFAVQSFRQWLRAKYGSNDKLQMAWGSTTADLQTIKPLLRKDAANDRAWLDMVDWYTQSMSDWAQFWMTETRRHWAGEIYLCTGGHAPPEHGADFGEQCRIAALVHGGVRITNEASDYAANFSLTRWVASAGRQYGAYYSFEPAGGVTPNGVIVRIYNATASGARGLHYYSGNLFDAEQARANFQTFRPQIKARDAIVDVAVFYPSTHIKLRGNDFLPKVRPLRDRFDFDYLSEKQILDGGLKRVKALVLLHGNTAELPVWKTVGNWVNSGGLLIYADGMGRLRTVEGDETVHRQVIGGAGQGRVLVFQGSGDTREFRDFAVDALRNAQELSPATRRMIKEDGKEDGVFATLCDGEILWLNTNSHPAQLRSLLLPADSIQSEPLR